MKFWHKILFSVLITLLVGGLAVVLAFVVPSNDTKKCENIHLSVTDYDDFKFISDNDVRGQMKRSIRNARRPLISHTIKIVP